MNKRVFIAMSGGIDSSVAAMLLLEQGFDLVGVTFRTFDSIKESCIAKEKGCCSVESIMEAKHLAEQLGFEHHILDFRDTFRQHVIANFVEEYSHGRTPNPCVLCNSHIKWGKLLEAADKYGCDMIATGHYARIAERDGHFFLRKAADTRKDQTYFLWMLTEDNLRRTIFPLGDFTSVANAVNGNRNNASKMFLCFICFYLRPLWVINVLTVSLNSSSLSSCSMLRCIR